MPKEVPTKRVQRRIDVTEYGIDFNAILEEIRPHLSGSHAEIGQKANMPATSVCNSLNGSVKLSLGMLASLAHASGGKLVVAYKPPKKRASTKQGEDR
ncbi:hypothetical protein [Neorhodopirellula pilleata]|uniref:HTH cro/C1-type domain-containing protein n=1 Tax=Neorhodopirellula pilleata TaxID=2714738 RepID=A0A5C6A706_9BACT|nr:hypothetical protein [Neorhodopirellula pilleata]TWT95772.1 hypothetical protein Pla100_34140 [Neorhodopirellula pilleata]